MWFVDPLAARERTARLYALAGRYYGDNALATTGLKLRMNASTSLV